MTMKRLFPLLFLSLFVLSACNDDDDRNVELNNAVLQFVDTRYNGAKIRNSEYESNGLLEVEILHDGKVKDIYFDSQNNWIYTSWDVRVADIPSATKEAVGNAYPGYVIDEVDFIERPAVVYYTLELEKGRQEITVFVTADGVILTDTTGESGSGPMSGETVGPNM